MMEKFITLIPLNTSYLQGFDKKFYSKLKKLGYNENKIKFLAGNSINVQVLEKIFGFYLKDL